MVPSLEKKKWPYGVTRPQNVKRQSGDNYPISVTLLLVISLLCLVDHLPTFYELIMYILRKLIFALTVSQWNH